MAGGYGDNEWSERIAADGDLHWKALLRHFIPNKPLIAAVEGYAVAGGTEILQAMDIRVAGEGATFGVAEVRRGLFPLGRLDGAAVAPDPLHDRGRPAADRPVRPGRRGQGDRAHRPRRARRSGAGQGPRDRRDHRGQRPAGRAGGAASRCGPPASCPRREGLALELEIGWPIFASEDAKEGPTAFAEKRAPELHRPLMRGPGPTGHRGRTVVRSSGGEGQPRVWAFAAEQGAGR